MLLPHIAAAIASVALIAAVLWDAFETIILPRSIVRRFRLARGWVRAIWLPWRFMAAGLTSNPSAPVRGSATTCT